MTNKIHIIMRCVPRECWKNHDYKNGVQVVYCGYLEFDRDVNPETEGDIIWHYCNWSCWTSDDKPKECQHLLIDHCNSDMAYFMNNNWFSHGDKKLASLEACYNEMTSIHEITEHFGSIWPTPKGTRAVTIGELQEITKG